MKGFSTIEMMIAMTVIALTLSAVIFVNFGSQNLLVAGETNGEATLIAQRTLEEAQALARKDFRLLHNIATTTQDGYYQLWQSVAPMQGDFFSTQVSSYVRWDMGGLVRSVKLTTLISNFESAVGGDTCYSFLQGDWSAPAKATNTLANLIGDFGGVYTVTSLDAYKGRLYAATSNSSFNVRTFFIFDVADPLHPALLGSLDNDAANNTGLADIAAADPYVYAASASSFAKGQLQIFDVSNPASPSIVSTFKIPTTTVSSAGLGNSIYYSGGYVYLGLTKAGGPEFIIFDVHDPHAPHIVGSYVVGHDINSIYVRDNYAFILHPTDASQQQQVTILDVSNPANPQPVPGGYFYANDPNLNGKSLYLVGDTLYIGTTVSSKPELYIASSPSPAGYGAAVPITKEIGSSVVGLIVRDTLAFLLTTKQGSKAGELQILNATSTVPFIAPIVLPGTLGTGAALDCEGNYIYMGSNDSTSNGSISAVTGA